MRAEACVTFLSLTVLCGCRQDMHDQPRYKPLAASAFFSDTTSARQFPEGTVARGQLETDEGYFTGKHGEDAISVIPIQVDRALLLRGEQRFTIFCTPCHGRLGDGTGMVVQRGFSRPPSYHSDRLREAPIGHFFDVMTNGYGAMRSYASRVPVRDRWAIAAYIRALQLSQNAKPSDVPAGEQAFLQGGTR